MPSFAQLTSLLVIFLLSVVATQHRGATSGVLAATAASEDDSGPLVDPIGGSDGVQRHRLRVSFPPPSGSPTTTGTVGADDGHCEGGVFDPASDACLWMPTVPTSATESSSTGSGVDTQPPTSASASSGGDGTTDMIGSDECYPGVPNPAATSTQSQGTSVQGTCMNCPQGSTLPGCVELDYDCGHGTLQDGFTCVCEPGWAISPITDQCSLFVGFDDSADDGSGNDDGSAMADDDESGRVLTSGDDREGSVQLRLSASPPPLWTTTDSVLAALAFAFVPLWFYLAKRADLV